MSLWPMPEEITAVQWPLIAVASSYSPLQTFDGFVHCLKPTGIFRYDRIWPIHDQLQRTMSKHLWIQACFVHRSNMTHYKSIQLSLPLRQPSSGGSRCSSYHEQQFWASWPVFVFVLLLSKAIRLDEFQIVCLRWEVQMLCFDTHPHRLPKTKR